MLFEANRLELLFDELVELGISAEAIKKGLLRTRKGIITSWSHRPHPSDKRVKLIDYDLLPEATKKKLPTREELIRKVKGETGHAEGQLQLNWNRGLADIHADNINPNDFFFFLDRTNNKLKSEDLKNASAWLRLLSKYRTPKETRLINFNTKADMRKAVVEFLLKSKNHLYGFKVSNTSVLQRKELAWSNAYETSFEACSNEPQIERERKSLHAALASLLHDNLGNNNRRILGRLNQKESQQILLPSGKIDFSEWNARTLIYLFTNPGRANKYDFENLYRRYLHECKRNERQPEVEISAVKQFLTCDEVKLYVTRERSGWAEHDKMLPHVFGKRPEYSLSKGGYDGFQVDFSSKIDGKQLMLTVVAAFDYMSEAVTGFDIGLVEDGKMVRTMYRNHLNTMGGRSFIEIESDRFSGNLAAETRSIFEQTCKFITQPTPNDPQGKAPNPKARFVERLIQELNRLTQNFRGWKGTNVTSIDRNRKPNPDYRNSNYVEGYTESVKQIIDLIAIYNNDTYNREKSRMQVCLESINPQAPVIPSVRIAMLLNQSTVIKVINGMLSFVVNRREYEYEFSEFDQHVHKMMKDFHVKVYYDETDMSTVDVFGEGEEYIATLGRLRRVSKSKAERTQQDLEEFGRQVTRREKTDERISRKSLEAEAAMYGVDISNLSIKDAFEVVMGARLTQGDALHISHQELFEDALKTPTAQQMTDFYDDRLIRANGEMVPVSVTSSEAKSNEQLMRELDRKKFKRNQTNKDEN